MQSETGSPGMVRAGGVDQQHCQRVVQPTDGGLQQRSFAQCEQPGLISGCDLPRHERLLGHIGRLAGHCRPRSHQRLVRATMSAVVDQVDAVWPCNGCCPRLIPGAARSRLTLGVGQKAAANRQLAAIGRGSGPGRKCGAPGLRLAIGFGQPELSFFELFLCSRPAFDHPTPFTKRARLSRFVKQVARNAPDAAFLKDDLSRFVKAW
jgi:hypothetical protein